MVLPYFIDIFLHLDKYLGGIIQDYGLLVYLILFMVIFLETGLVVTPFLPGDSLLFAAGTFAAIGSLNLAVLLIILIVAAVLGDSLNYAIGHKIGRPLFSKENAKFFNRKYLLKTEQFYEKHGNKAIILARFIPIIRTFAPLVAGIGNMHYPKFLAYNIIGAIIWIALFTLGGYFFGSIPFVKENFFLVIIAIIIASFIPVIIELTRHLRKRITS